MARDDQRTLETVFDIPDPKKWDPEHPRLYTLTCEPARDGRILTSATRRVGFREIEVKGNQLLINGVPVKLRGVNRHEVSPDRGRSPYPDAGRKDVELFRRANVNYIRTSHYPPDESLLDAADELGMFVEVEAPFCWAHQSNPDPTIKNDLYLRQHLETVNAFRSHPSVIMWSLGNESVNYEDFRQAGEAIAEIDPSRPRVFSQWGPDADKGELEIANHHYPGPSGPEEYRNYQRPVVFDEYCHINAYNRLEPGHRPGSARRVGRTARPDVHQHVSQHGSGRGCRVVGNRRHIFPSRRTPGGLRYLGHRGRVAAREARILGHEESLQPRENMAARKRI